MVDPGNERGETARLDSGRATGTSLDRTDVNGKRRSQSARRVHESHKCAQERGKVGVEADDGSQEEVRLKVFHPKEEWDVWLLRAQGSFIATGVRASQEARLCGSARNGATHRPDCWDDKNWRLPLPGGGRDEGSRPRPMSRVSTWMTQTPKISRSSLTETLLS